MADNFIVMYSALSATLAFASILFQLAAFIAETAETHLQKLRELHYDAVIEADLARKRYNRIKRR